MHGGTIPAAPNVIVCSPSRRHREAFSLSQSSFGKRTYRLPRNLEEVTVVRFFTPLKSRFDGARRNPERSPGLTRSAGPSSGSNVVSP